MDNNVINANIYIWQRPMKDKLNTMAVNYDEVHLNEFVLVYIMTKSFSLENMNSFLDSIFDTLSEYYPEDYHARSLGTSDLIMIRDPEHDKSYNYVVDIQGFKEVKVLVG